MGTTINIQPAQIDRNTLQIPLSVTYKDGTASSGTIHADISTIRQWIQHSPNASFDLMFMSFCIYGIDRFIPRKSNSVDGWSREISVSFPVQNVTNWRSVREELTNTISFLTGDYWEISFHKSKHPNIDSTELADQYKQTFTQVNLFSGGLDSLIGAIDTLEGNKKRVLFVSHYDSTMGGPRKDQRDLAPKLLEQYKERFTHIPSIKVVLIKQGKGETTSRSRSIVFIGLANLFASALNIPICVPENGTVSLNYPLSASRRTSCSTRTTHPTFIIHLASLFGKLNFTPRLINPYRLKTKGEMVNGCKNLALLQKIIPLSNSCGKRGHRAHWEDGSKSHCGICMPCVYRRASLLKLKDSTTYGNSIKKLNPYSKKGQDVTILQEFLKQNISLDEIRRELITNGVKDINNLNDYSSLVVRSRTELKTWLDKQ